jgi:hypothetical protein
MREPVRSSSSAMNLFREGPRVPALALPRRPVPVPDPRPPRSDDSLLRERPA